MARERVASPVDQPFRHIEGTDEDAQYKGRTFSSSQPQSGAPAVESGEGIDRLAVLAATGGVGALLIGGTAAVTGIRRRNRRLAPS
jgi:hypothetical protein